MAAACLVEDAGEGGRSQPGLQLPSAPIWGPGRWPPGLVGGRRQQVALMNRLRATPPHQAPCQVRFSEASELTEASCCLLGPLTTALQLLLRAGSSCGQAVGLARLNFLSILQLWLQGPGWGWAGALLLGSHSCLQKQDAQITFLTLGGSNGACVQKTSACPLSISPLLPSS